MALGSREPAALGAGAHRSIKDEPEATVVAPAQKPAVAKIVAPPVRPQLTRAAPRPAPVPTCASRSECMVLLKVMIDDPSRSWIGKTQSPAEYANGTRLFAYRALRNQLTCPQLTSGLNEVAAIGGAFTVPAKKVSTTQARRVLALKSEVERELQAEFTSRCKVE